MPGFLRGLFRRRQTSRSPEALASIFDSVRVALLRPEDLLVFRSSRRLSLDEMESIHRFIEEQTGHGRILILTDGADLALLRPEEGAREERVPLPAHRPIAPAAPRGKAPGAIS